MCEIGQIGYTGAEPDQAGAVGLFVPALGMDDLKRLELPAQSNVPEEHE
jgi:hypothetical protein